MNFCEKSDKIRKALDKHQSLHFIPPHSQVRKLCADNELDGLVPLLPGRFCVCDFQKKNPQILLLTACRGSDVSGVYLCMVCSLQV